MTELTPDVAHHTALDARMVQVAKGIRLLQMVSWPASAQKHFLDEAAQGRYALPVIDYPTYDFSEARRELEAISKAADHSHPLGHYICDSARSWAIAAELLESLGTREVMTHSIRLFGRPDEVLPGHGPTTREAARHFIDIADELDRELLAPSECVSISATALQLQLQGALDDFFNARVIEVVLDPDLIAKAAAGATRIRLRHGAAFSDYDRHQLIEHEAFVHSLTALNGREQPHLQSMALSSPRATATQEGLAVFAEQITGTIDIERMKRISLRIEAVAMAMEGADFLQVFHYFRDGGQSDIDSFTSAQRVFRGVPTTGGAGVHQGHRLPARPDQRAYVLPLGAAPAQAAAVPPPVRREDDPGRRAADGAAVRQRRAGAAARWLPQWVVRANGLAGMLAFSLFANRIRLDTVAQGTDFLDL
jgi:uncharacterized protein (TIGR02421 family)